MPNIYARLNCLLKQQGFLHLEMNYATTLQCIFISDTYKCEHRICMVTLVKSNGAPVLPYGEHDNFLIIPSLNLI